MAPATTSATRRRLLSFLLASNVAILLVTLGLMAWALSILHQSIGFALDPDSRSFILVPIDELITYTSTWTITGYRTTSVRPPITFTSQPTTYYVPVGFQGSSAPVTYSLTTRTWLPATYGIDPTKTETRTVSGTALTPISHLVLPGDDKDDFIVASSPSPTPAPPPPLYERQESSSAVRLASYQFEDAEPLPYFFQPYESITINHGFGRFFFEGGIDYLYKGMGGNTPYKGYSPNDLARIRALTALCSLGLVAVIGLLSCHLIHLVSIRKRVAAIGGRKSNYISLALVALLCLTYIPFWTIYGIWTHRNSTVEMADKTFQKSGLGYDTLGDLLQSMPWQAMTVAFIVFWTVSIITSFGVTLLSMLTPNQDVDSDTTSHATQKETQSSDHS